MTTVTGTIVNKRGDAVPKADLTFFSRTTGEINVAQSQAQGEYVADLTPGQYVWVAIEEGYAPTSNSLNIPTGVQTLAGPAIVLEEDASAYSPPVTSPPGLRSFLDQDFLDQINDPRFSIEAPVNFGEANQASSLFSVANIMLAGLGRYTNGGEEKLDMFGMLNLYFGLQDKSLANRLVLPNMEGLWERIETDLKTLAERLDRLQVDVGFLGREAKRQFNLGTTNSVPGNVEFPALFRRYVELGTDPALSVDIRAQKDNVIVLEQFRLQEAFALLRELKDVTFEIVRSLSRTGTAATRRVNRDWSEFEADALDILEKVAVERASDDVDERTPWAIMAVLTGKDRSEFLPYVALYKHGFKLLTYALAIYKEAKDKAKLEKTDPDTLLDLFQRQGETFWTTKIREEAEVITRYPLTNWG